MKSARRQLRAHRRAIEQAELRAGGDGPPKRLVGARRAFNLRLAQLRGGEACAICLDDDDDTEKVKTPCEHTFCRACLQKWLRQQCTCPLCRRDFSEEDPDWLAQNEDLRCGNRLGEEMDTSTINVSPERTYDDTFTDVEIAWLKELFPDYDHRLNIFHDLRYFSPDIRRTMWEMVDDQTSRARRDDMTWLHEFDKRRAWKASLIQAWLLSKQNLFLDPASYDHSIPWYRQPGVDAFLSSEVRRINETWVETVGRTLFGWWS